MNNKYGSHDIRHITSRTHDYLPAFCFKQKNKRNTEPKTQNTKHEIQKCLFLSWYLNYLKFVFRKKKEKIIKKLLYTYTLVVMVHYSNVFFFFFFVFFFCFFFFVFFCNSLKVNVHFSIVSHCNQDNLKAFFFQNSILLHAERKIKMPKYTS